MKPQPSRLLSPTLSLSLFETDHRRRASSFSPSRRDASCLQSTAASTTVALAQRRPAEAITHFSFRRAKSLPCLSPHEAPQLRPLSLSLSLLARRKRTTAAASKPQRRRRTPLTPAATSFFPSSNMTPLNRFAVVGIFGDLE